MNTMTPPAISDAESFIKGANTPVAGLRIAALEGVTVNIDNPAGSGFRFENPNATSSCACDSSFLA